MYVRLTSLLPGGLACLAAVCILAGAVQSVAAKPVMNDQAISDKIEDELFYDPGVISTKIDIQTTEGIVTLTGTVNNILAKERAARIAETVKGVRAIVNQVSVQTSVTRLDTEIQSDVEGALLEDPATESYEITTTVNDGQVTLSGTVDSHQERELVKTVAKGIRGVTAIDDQMRIDYQSDRSDYEIQKEIEQGLQWDAYVDDSLVTVTVQDGQVSLSGTVGSAAEKRLARTEAWVSGVSSVDDDKLSVEKWARDDEMRANKYPIKSTEELKNAIEDALLYDPRILSFDVNVEVKGSLVTLRGEVDNLKAKRAAEQDARNTVGVSYVGNRIKVRLDKPILDTEIAEDVRGAFARDPYMERFDVTVAVLDGTAYLYGTVDSLFEKNWADDVAARVSGVLDVKNYVNVDYNFPQFYDPYTDDAFVDGDNLSDYEQRAPLKTDSEIEAEIESEMWWSPFVDSDEVAVNVDNGIATLTGTVDTWNERQAASENAYEGGATLVDNDLVVSYE